MDCEERVAYPQKRHFLNSFGNELIGINRIDYITFQLNFDFVLESLSPGSIYHNKHAERIYANYQQEVVEEVSTTPKHQQFMKVLLGTFSVLPIKEGMTTHYSNHLVYTLKEINTPQCIIRWLPHRRNCRVQALLVSGGLLQQLGLILLLSVPTLLLVLLRRTLLTPPLRPVSNSQQLFPVGGFLP